MPSKWRYFYATYNGGVLEYCLKNASWFMRYWDFVACVFVEKLHSILLA